MQPLSRDHHFALLLAQRVLHVLDGRAWAGPVSDVSSLLQEARRFHDEVFRVHAEKEERLLTRERGLPEASWDRLLGEHAQLCDHMRRACDDGAGSEERETSLRAYASLLETHVRFEEREMFPQVEALFSPQDLEAVAQALGGVA